MIALLSGNQRILLSVDERGAWSQLYYPRPGMHQQLLQARLGLFDEADGSFSWLDHDDGTPRSMHYVDGSDAGRTQMRRQGLHLTLDDMVHPDMDLVIRRVRLRNPGTTRRAMRVFCYQSFTMAGPLYQDTAYWDPETRSINHYKGSYFFRLQGRPEFDAHTCGEHTLKGLRGSYVDAEDGALHKNSISHGAADSVVQWNVAVPPGEERAVHLLMSLGRSRADIAAAQRALHGRDPDLFIAEAVGYTRQWAQNRQPRLMPELSGKVARVYDRSLFVLRDCQSADGAIIASPDARTLHWDGDTYSYCWWRDGAYICRAMSEVGLHRNALSFLAFAARCQEEEGCFLHRHLPDGTLGSTWHPPPFLQVDQTASVLDAVWHQYECTRNLDQLLPSWEMVRRGADFLMHFVEDGLPRPSFDLWEEKKSINTYTVAAVVRGLRSAALVGRALSKRSELWAAAAQAIAEVAVARLWNPERDTFYKSVGPQDAAVDASVLQALLHGLVEPSDPRFARVVETVEDRLWSSVHGGIARYEGDVYYGPENPWIICTLWLAQCHLALGDRARCLRLIEWAARQAGPTDLLPEQVDAGSGDAASVSPLVWSHSTFIETVNAYVRGAPRLADEPLPMARTGGDAA